MAKNINHVSHKKSKLKVNGMPQLPSADAIVEGEIAVNFGEGVETLSIKNESGDVVTFSSDHFYTEQKLGSAFTGENSAKTVTDIIEDNELVTATALNDLKENKLDVSAYTEPTEYWVSGSVEGSVILVGGNNAASGYNSVAEGAYAKAFGNQSHAEGYYNTASGDQSHAEGSNTNAIGSQSHAEGNSTNARGPYSHAEGNGTSANGYKSHAEGDSSTASGDSSHAEGQNTIADGSQSHAEGQSTHAIGGQSHAEGQSTVSVGLRSHAEGYSTTASGTSSHAEGTSTTAGTENSHAEGQNTLASGTVSHAEGYNTTASGQYSHAEGDNTIASGVTSHAEGSSTHADGMISHAEGSSTYADGVVSHAEGSSTIASGNVSHAEGSYTVANGNNSHAEGSYTVANNQSEHASGQYNVSNSASTTFGDSGNTLFSVGNGTVDDARHNAFEIRQNGDIYIVSGGTDIKLQDNIGRSAELWVSGTGENSVALKGSSGTASGSLSVVEGRQSSATSIGAHAEGQGSLASGDFSHAEGSGGARATGMGSHAEGSSSVASGQFSHAEGQGSTASGASSHAEGTTTVASGTSSHAEGNGTHANGDFSHTEGNITYAFGSQSHAEGQGSLASGNTSHAEGQSAQAIGSSSHAEGSYSRASGETSHAEGNYTQANGSNSHAEGQYSQSNGNTSHAEGYYTKSDGVYSHAEGNATSALTESSHAEGLYTKAEGLYSHAEGYMSIASGESSHAEGREGNALGSNSHAEGMQTKAIGMRSHAEGNGTSATSDSSHAEGQYTEANGDYSHAEGSLTIANNNSEHASGKYNVSNSASTEFGDSGNTLFSVGNGRYNSELDKIVRHNAFEIRQNGDIYIVNKDGNDVRLQDELGNITVDQVLDNTTSASTNPVSSKAVYSALTADELVWANAFVALSGTVSAHTENTNIHLTAAEKTNLDSITGTVGTMAYENKTSYSSATEVNTALADKASTGDIVNFFDDAKYEDSGTTKVINFYHGGTIKATIDATDFIKDGMIDTVSAVTSGSTTVLVITWNTDAGKSQTIIDIGDIFEADNYYTKSQTSGATELSTAFDAKLDKTVFDTKIGSAFTGANSGVTITEYIEENELITSTALNDLKANKLDASAYTPTDLSNYYTKDETSGKTEISNALGTKVNSATFTGHTADTTVHFSGDEKANLDSLAANIAAISGITSTKVSNWDAAVTDSHTHSNKSALDNITGNVGTMAYENASSYSSATEVNTALGLKVDKTDFDDKLGSGFTGANSGNTVTSVIESNERVTASAFNDLQANKLDVSAFTAYSGAVDTTIGSKASQSDLATLSGTVNGHTADTTIHVTSADKTSWNAKAEVSDIPSVSGYADAVKYNSTSHYVEFYHNGTGGTKVFEYDASPFIIDGMIQNVEIKDVTISGSSVPCLVVSFNTDAGKQDINIPLSEIFDSNLYYKKTETSGATELSTAFNGKVDNSVYSAFSGSVTSAITDLSGQSETIAAALVELNNNKLNTDSVVTAITSSNSGSTAPISVKVVAENELVVSTALNDLYDKIESIFSQGSSAPSSTPRYTGQMYMDTSTNTLYVATGTSSSSDWKSTK